MSLTPPSLRSGFLWTLMGNVTYAASQWGILIVIAKLGTPVMVGWFALGLAVSTPIFQLFNLQLRTVQATDAVGHFKFHDYLFLRVASTAAALATVSAMAFITTNNRTASSVILLAGLMRGVESISDVYYGNLQRHEKMRQIAISMIIRGALSLLTVTAVLFLGGGLVAATAAITLSWLSVLLFVDVRTEPFSNRDDFTRSLCAIPALVRTSYPLGIVMFFVALNTHLPRYFLERGHGAKELGIFAALASLVVAGNTIMSALGQASTPRLSHSLAAGNTASVFKVAGILITIGGALALAGIGISLLVGKPLLTVIYKAEYAGSESVRLLVWLMIAAGVSYLASALGYIISAARLFSIQSPIGALMALVTAVSCWVLVPRFGSLGAAWAMLAGSTSQLLCCVVVLFVFSKGGIKAANATTKSISPSKYGLPEASPEPASAPNL
jgi:O-antigen/teichoic acid export membrane protein